MHAFSPLEVWEGAATLGWPLERYLAALKEAGKCGVSGLRGWHWGVGVTALQACLRAGKKPWEKEVLSACLPA